jgi:hypothetical protein
MKSILAVDCGSTTTTAVLIEQNGGQPRLRASGQAHSTYGPAWEDVTVGVREAIRHVEIAVGRTLLSQGGWPITPHTSNQQGVDAFVVVSSASPPLRVVMAGLTQDISLASAGRAAATTYTHVTNVISLDAGQNDQQNNTETWLQAIRDGEPDVVLLVGGTNEGAKLPVIDIAQAISMALSVLQDVEKPNILFAGNERIRPQIADILGPLTALKSVTNVRPTLDTEDLAAVRSELEKLYIQRKMSRLPGFDDLGNWTKYPIEPASRSFEKLVAYISQRNQLNVIGINIGSRSTAFSARAQGQLSTSIRSDAGVGHSLASFLELVSVERFHRWLPFDISLEALNDRLLNKSLYPTTIPTDIEDLLIEHAVAREILRVVLNQARPDASDVQWNLLMGAGRVLTGAPHAAYAVMMMLDGFEPWGVTSLTLDRSGVVNVLGAIAAIDPVAAVNVTFQDAFLNLGTVIAPVGHGRRGKTALRIKVSYAEDEILEKEIPYGSMEVIALTPGNKATIELRPARHFDVGLGQPGRGAVAEVEGGALGIIVDARGRPLRLPKDDVQRQELLQQWLSALGVGHVSSVNNH